MIRIKIADIPIGLDNRYDYIEQLSRDYLTDDEPELIVSASDSELEKENEITGRQFSMGYVESTVLFRNIAEQLPKYGAVVFHGAVLAKGDKAYAFTAKSGVGKTTHTRLWISEFKDSVHYINGDKPIIRLIDGVPHAFGTPWRGKEKYGVNESRPLAAIALLERGEKNTAEVIEAKDSVLRLVKQIYIPRDPVCAALAMRVADSIASSVRFVELKCNTQCEAAWVAARAMLVE